MPSRIFVPFLLLLALSVPLQAAVDLVTLPTRDATQLTIYNSEDITMVREHRLLTVKEGINRIQFSWANTLIDPTSIEFRILDKQDKVDLVDTTFPAGRNDALQWNIKSQIAGKISVEIRYFTSGITWAADYVGIANEDETKINLTGYVRVSNNSGEQYDNAQTQIGSGQYQPRGEDRGSGDEGRQREATKRTVWQQMLQSRQMAATAFQRKSDGRDVVLQTDAESWKMWPRSPNRSSSRAFPNISSSRSRVAKTSRTRSPSGSSP